jgi:hypothetical protein
MSCLFILQIRPFYATHLTIICCCQAWACALFRNNKQHVVLGQKRKCQRVEESGLWRIQRERGIEVQYLPNGTNAGYMIYWIISTENDHWHHHKFIKYEKRFRKEGNASAYISSKIFATSAFVWTRSTSFSSFQRSNWSPTYILHLFHLEDTALLFLFLSESLS